MAIDLDPSILSANLISLDSQLNSTSTPLAQRFRALFTLKSIANRQAIDIIGKGFDGESALLGHELAYCLGQIKDPYALTILERVLRDESEHPMVRHEAAEAMGAISDLGSIEVLKEFVGHENDSIRETCEIAIAKIEWDNSEEGKRGVLNPNFPTIDPAPATSSHSPLATGPTNTTLSVPSLRTTLLDPTLPLFTRYRAMFALRNLSSESSILALASGFSDSSALFRHEIAYIFGQLTSPHSVPSLIEVLRNSKEEDMVRHEAAEALGGIADERCLPVLKEFARGWEEVEGGQKKEVPRVVRESCEVALDMYEYENSGEFSYAVPLDLDGGAKKDGFVAVEA